VADVVIWTVSKDISWSKPLEGHTPVTIKTNETSILPLIAVVIAGQSVIFESRAPVPNLPAGEWEFQAWHERSGYISNWPKGRFPQKIVSGRPNVTQISELRP